jgi:hypothetical protein
MKPLEIKIRTYFRHKSGQKRVFVICSDCYPTSKDWITAMSSQFTMQKTIVLGYGKYEKNTEFIPEQNHTL